MPRSCLSAAVALVPREHLIARKHFNRAMTGSQRVTCCWECYPARLHHRPVSTVHHLQTSPHLRPPDADIFEADTNIEIGAFKKKKLGIGSNSVSVQELQQLHVIVSTHSKIMKWAHNIG